MHNAKCLNQQCDQSVQLCGRAKFGELFDPLTAKLGDTTIEVFQHLKLAYTKSDGSKVMTWCELHIILDHFQTTLEVEL